MPGVGEVLLEGRDSDANVSDGEVVVGAAVVGRLREVVAEAVRGAGARFNTLKNLKRNIKPPLRSSNLQRRPV